METADRTALPPAKEVRDLLEGLLGKDVDFADGRRVTDAGGLVGVYVDDRLGMRAVVACDIAMAAYVGAAIGLMPAGGAQDAVDDGELFPVLRDNAAEVLNVMAALFNVGTAPHLRLYGHYAAGDDLPGDVAQRLGSLGPRVDWAVAVKGYGRGELSIILT
ncbi:MAG: hypothetical protein AVDCRST_MAG35-1897 [uncultured Quadrisphaera sp.]|uniref:Uncharacterized protein n=1 Tax=uncultured Quadrisphaera sp. TaxID=904978 RepID=A0A6J4PNH2_9ACTN|nr:MAG: hypothetical protein AVDCRST_MAG35-1897 [uncultured Quadrisphaera sp.]